MDTIQLIVGITLLFFAGDWLVRGAVGVAQRFGISPLVIGLTLVAFGTSLPELVVSLNAALNGVSGIALGNIVGSNVANVLLVLGLPACVLALSCEVPGLHRSGVFMVAISVAFTILCADGNLDRLDGTLLIGLLIYFLFDLVRGAARGRAKESEPTHAGVLDALVDDTPEAPASVPLLIVFIVAGTIGLPIAAHFTVAGASGIAQAFHISESAIGLTVVALGTSLPELATAVMATVRRENAVAMGNVVGSNVFNILAIIGLTALVSPFSFVFAQELWSFLAMLVCAFLVLAFIFRQQAIGRAMGLVMVMLYGAFVVLAFHFGKMMV